MAKQSAKTNFNFSNSVEGRVKHFSTTQSYSFVDNPDQTYYSSQPSALGKSKAKQFKKTNFMFGFRSVSKEQVFKPSRSTQRANAKGLKSKKLKKEIGQIYGGGGFYNSRNTYDSVNKISYTVGASPTNKTVNLSNMSIQKGKQNKKTSFVLGDDLPNPHNEYHDKITWKKVDYNPIKKNNNLSHFNLNDRSRSHSIQKVIVGQTHKSYQESKVLSQKRIKEF